MSYKTKYDLIFSIGEACSCTQSIRKCRMQYSSYPFYWIVGCDIVNRCKMLTNNLEKFIDKEDLVFSHKVESTQCNAYKNKYNGILFNHDFKIDETLDQGYEGVKSKYERRLNRLYSNIEESKKILVVYLQIPDSKEIVKDEDLIEAHNILKSKFGDKITLLYIHNTDGIKLENRKSIKIGKNIEKVTFEYDKHDKEITYAVNFKTLRKYFSIYKISRKFMDTKNLLKRLTFRTLYFPTYIHQLSIENKNKKRSKLHYFLRRLTTKRNKNNCYNHIISLGYNCEVQFRFYKYFKFEETNLFNWSFINTIDDLIRVLNDLSLIGKSGFKQTAPLYTCIETNISFHGKAKWKKIKDNPELIQKDIEDLSERLNYLKEKFIKTLKSNDSKLYIYKIKNSDISENINEKILELHKTLETLEGGASSGFNLLVITEEKYAKLFKNNDKYIFRTVRYFAPDNDVTSNSYLDNGWDEIFDEFYSKKPKNYKKNKKYKFE